MKPECSLPYSHQPIAVPYSAQKNLVHTFRTYFLKIHYNINSHLHLGITRAIYPSDILITLLYSLRITYPAHVILLDMITLITLVQRTTGLLVHTELFQTRLNVFTYNTNLVI
jgi:hypothetical protein